MAYSRIKELRDKRATITNAMKAMLATLGDEDRDFTPEEEADYEAKKVSLARNAKLLTMEEEQEEANLQLSAVQSAGMTLRDGTRVQMGRDLATTKPFVDFGEQLACVYLAAQGEMDPRLLPLRAASGMSEGVLSEGGFLVQREFVNTLIEPIYETGRVASRVFRPPFSGRTNGIDIPAIDETSRVDGSQFGGVTAYWAAEGDTVNASKPKVRLMKLSLNKLFAIYYATEEIIQDAPLLGAMASRAFATAMLFKVENAIIRGTGAGQPMGILTGPGLVTVAKEAGQANGTLLVENILKMWARCLEPYRQNAVWFINQAIEPQLYGMGITFGTGGQAVFMPAGTIAGQPFSTLMGRPIVTVPYCSALGVVGDIILADLGRYMLIDKALRSDQSMHVRFLNDEQTFRFIYPVDGQPMDHSAITPFKGTDTLSPTVTLAAR